MATEKSIGFANDSHIALWGYGLALLASTHRSLQEMNLKKILNFVFLHVLLQELLEIHSIIILKNAITFLLTATSGDSVVIKL